MSRLVRRNANGHQEPPRGRWRAVENRRQLSASGPTEKGLTFLFHLTPAASPPLQEANIPASAALHCMVIEGRDSMKVKCGKALPMETHLTRREALGSLAFLFGDLARTRGAEATPVAWQMATFSA